MVHLRGISGPPFAHAARFFSTLKGLYVTQLPAKESIEKTEKGKDVQGKCQSLWNIREDYDREIATEKLESEAKLREWCYVFSQNEKEYNLEVLGRNIPWINFHLQTKFYFQDRRKRVTVNEPENFRVYRVV